MSVTEWIVEPLGDHDRAAFSCGVEPLDRYFHRQAGQDSRRNVTTVYVLVGTATRRVIGFYTLSAGSVAPTDLPPSLMKRLPRYERLPIFLLGRLAIDARYRGQGFGGVLLRDALLRAYGLSRQITAIAVVVDAKDEVARDFYEHYGFLGFAHDPNRLYIAIETVRNIG